MKPTPNLRPQAGRVVELKWGDGMASFITTKATIAIFRRLRPDQNDWTRDFVSRLKKEKWRIRGYEILKEISDSLLEAFRVARRNLQAAHEASMRDRVRRRRAREVFELEALLGEECEPAGEYDAWNLCETRGLPGGATWPDMEPVEA